MKIVAFYGHGGRDQNAPFQDKIVRKISCTKHPAHRPRRLRLSGPNSVSISNGFRDIQR